MKRTSTSFIMACASLSLFFCTSASSGEIVIASSVYTTQHEFFADIIKGMRKAAAAKGVKLIVTDANSNATTQNNQLEDFAMQKVKAIILFPVDPQAVVPAVEHAIDLGIPVIEADIKLNTDRTAAFLGSDNIELGVRAGEYAKKYITEKMDGKANIGVVTWFSDVGQQERFKGFKDTLANMPDVKIVAVQNGDAREESMTAVENILQANPGMNMYFGTNEGTVLGGLAAIESANKTKDVAIIGIDISQDGGRALKEGNIIALIAQQPVVLGEKAIEAALDVISGKTIPKNIVIPVMPVDKTNVDSFMN